MSSIVYVFIKSVRAFSCFLRKRIVYAGGINIQHLLVKSPFREADIAPVSAVQMPDIAASFLWNVFHVSKNLPKHVAFSQISKGWCFTTLKPHPFYPISTISP